MINKIMDFNFRIGELSANIQMKGVYNKDFSLNNIGINEKKDVVLLDSAHIEVFDFPINLDVEKMAVCLMPIIRKASFKDLSWFRLGYICCGGQVSEIIINSLISKGLSSFNFWNDKKYDFNKLEKNINFDNAIEWQKADTFNMFDKWCGLEEYECREERKVMSTINKYYLDLYYLVVYYTFMEKRNEYLSMCIILLSLGINEYKKMRYICAYGIIKKMILFAKEKNVLRQIKHSLVSNLLLSIEIKGNSRINYWNRDIDYIINSDYNISQLLWILSDLDNVQI